MKDTNSILCKVKFKNSNTITIKTEIGFLHEEDIMHFFTDENNFIQFTNKDTLTIPKCDVLEIVRYRVQEIIVPDNERQQWNHSIQKNLIPEMSFL